VRSPAAVNSLLDQGALHALSARRHHVPQTAKLVFPLALDVAGLLVVLVVVNR